VFTGLIEDIGIVKGILNSKIEIETKLCDIAKGDSVAVNGVCLTVTSVKQGVFVADYSQSTDRVTTLSKLKKKSKVNLERALKLFSRFGGHIVSGHVEGIARVEKIEKLGRFYKTVFSCSESITEYCVSKGSIAIDGMSLTLSLVFPLKFEIFVIPETFNNTAIQFKRIGDEVNVETDTLAKYVKKFINREKNGISFEFLKGAGII
jgi:riboflavin synthase